MEIEEKLIYKDLIEFSLDDKEVEELNSLNLDKIREILNI